METQCQSLNCISVQTNGVVLLAPNFVNHLVTSFKPDLQPKKADFRTFAQLTPSGKIKYALIRYYTNTPYDTSLPHTL